MSKIKHTLYKMGFHCWVLHQEHIKLEQGKLYKTGDSISELFINDDKKQLIKFYKSDTTEHTICSILRYRNYGNIGHENKRFLYHDITPKELKEYLKTGEIAGKEPFKDY